jgi:hypothetical protein
VLVGGLEDRSVVGQQRVPDGRRRGPEQRVAGASCSSKDYDAVTGSP